MRRAYIIELIPEKKGYSVYIPAFDGWTEGKDLADALYMAADYIGITGITMEDMGLPVPEDIEYTAKEGRESYVAVDFTEYRRKKENRKIKKTLSIKSWINEAAEREGINFSATLEDALIAKLKE